LKRAAAESTDGAPVKSASEIMGPGAAFLAAKRREVAGDEVLKRQAGELARWLQQQVSDTVRDSSVRVCPTEGMALAAAHLVERARLDHYRARIAQARQERVDLRFLTSGAWPPYSFCELIS
jgi:Gas vesicle synthesis protein GvpL/GvpF